jgi:hypothetical protein
MAKLVAPDGVLFVINDTGPGQAEETSRRLHGPRGGLP